MNKKKSTKKISKAKINTVKKAKATKKTKVLKKVKAASKVKVTKKTKAIKKTKVTKKVKAVKKVKVIKKAKVIKQAKKPTKAERRYLSDNQIKHFRTILLATQAKILNDVDHIEQEELKSHRDATGDLSGYSLHMADVGTDNYNQELALDVVGNEHDILYQIDKALGRIENNTYGICEIYDINIPVSRLNAIPWTAYCKEAAEQIEKEMKRG